MSQPPRLRVQLAAFALTRTIVSTGYRMVYPFIGAIARGVGVEPVAISRVIALRSALLLLNPLMVALTDRRGRRGAMLIGLGMFAAGLLLVVLWPTFPALVAGLLLSAAGKFIFDPAVQAYLGDRVPYRQRGLAVAVTEMGWSLSFVIGMPVVAWLIARAGWLAPFPAIAVLGLVMVVIVWRLLPGSDGSHYQLPSLREAARVILAHPSALAGLTVSLLISAANEVISIIYGLWFEADFGLKVTALGLTAAVIGAAELGGEGLVAGLTDRLGKRRSVALGGLLNAVMGLALPLLGRNVIAAHVGLFLFYITFEFTVVAAIPLMTELVPQARATLLAGNMAAFGAGRMLGALVGPGLFGIGLVASGAASAALNGLAVLVLVAFVREAQPGSLPAGETPPG